MKIIKLIIAGLLILGITYGFEFFELWTFYVVFDREKDLILYLVPIGMIFFILLSFAMRYCNLKLIHSILYNIFFGILGIQMQLLFFMIIFHIVNSITKLEVYISLLIIIPIPLLLSLYGFINPWITNIDRITLNFPGFNKKLTIAHLSDIHFGVQIQKEFAQKVVNMLINLNPDIVVITGDLSDGSMKIEEEWLEPFNTLSMPILYITGNHEEIYGKNEILKLISRTNIRHIGNSIQDICGIKVVGIDFDSDLKSTLCSFKNKMLNETCPLVLLSHVPKLKPDDLKEYNIFLFLAGHTHGGQLFPFHIPTYFSNACFGGLYSKDNYHVYVSTGVGFANIPMRTFSKSVIGLITIKGTD